MSLTMAQANAQLANISTTAELRNLISHLDTSASGTTTVLYSGTMSDGQYSGDIAQRISYADPNIRIIDRTEAAKFLDVDKNPALDVALRRIFDGDDPSDKGSSANQFLYGGVDANGKRIANGAWDIASENFAAGAQGDVISITPNATHEGVFAKTEMEALLNNSNVATINGVPREDLIHARDRLIQSGVSEVDADRVLVNHVNASSTWELHDLQKKHGTDVLGDPSSKFLQPGGEELGKITSDFNNTLTERATERLSNYKKTGNAENIVKTMKAIGNLGVIGQAVANKLGVVGDVVAFKEAYDNALNDAIPLYKEGRIKEGDEAFVNSLLQAAADASLGMASGWLAAEIMGQLTLPMHAGGPWGSAGATLLTLGAGIVGATYGPDAAKKLGDILFRIPWEYYFGNANDSSSEEGRAIAEAAYQQIADFVRQGQILSSEEGRAIAEAAYQQIADFVLQGQIQEAINEIVNQALKNAFAPLNSHGPLDNLLTGIRDLFNQAEATRSPLILDLDGDGIETLGKAGGVFFDHDGNRFAELSGWVGADDGLLVWDRNGNGQIDNGTELFGNNSLLADGDKAAHGFAALASFDSNGDGLVNADDLNWGLLQVWLDVDSDGITDAGELFSLETLGIQSLSLSYNTQNITDAQGNQHLQTGSYTHIDGTVREMTDVWFGSDLARTVDLDLVEVSEEIAALPNILGFGNVHSLHQAMARDSSGALQTLVEDFIATDDPGQRAVLLTQILYTWAGVAELDPNSRGGVVDARKVVALETFLGDDYVGVWCWGELDANPHTKAAPVLNQAFEMLTSYAYNQLMRQTHLAPFFDAITLSIDLETFQLSFNLQEVTELLQVAYEEDSGHGIMLLRDFAAVLKSNGEYGQQLLGQLRSVGDLDGTGFSFALATLGYEDMHLLLGDAENNTLSGSTGNDLLFGGAGDDTLYGDHGEDILDGGAGNDRLVGGYSNDVFVFAKGSGHDTVDAYEGSYAKQDRIRLAGLSPEAVIFETVTRVEGSSTFYDLRIRIKETGETLTVLSGAGNDSWRQIQSVEFGDGTVWSWAEILQSGLHGTDGDDVLRLNQAGRLFGDAGSDTLYGSTGDDLLFGGAGNDVLYGNSGHDVLDGGAGDDLLVGQNGNDVFVFTKGSGHDTVDAYEGSYSKQDRIRLAGLSPEAVIFETVTRVEGSSTFYDLRIRIKETGETLTVLSGAGNDSWRQIQSVEFGDGTVWSWAEILQSGLHGTDGDDVLRLNQAGRLFGDAGNDTLYGSTGDDLLFGGAGNDVLYGNSGHDVLDGGAGDDLLVGQNGNDVFVFTKGSGHDTVDAYEGSYSKQDRIRLAGLSPEAVIFETVTRVEGSSTFYDLRIRIKETDETLTVLSGAGNDSWRQIQSVEFGDGTVWSWAEILQSGLHGTDGDDVLRLNQAGRLFGDAGNDTLYGSTGDDLLFGGAGNDVLYGNSGHDVLDGGAGDDLLVGQNGNDVFVFTKGSGHDTVDAYEGSYSKQDRIRLAGLSPEAVIFETVTRVEGNYTYFDLRIRIKETDETLTVLSGAGNDSWRQIQSVEFGDGTVWSWAEILQSGLHGTDGDDVLRLNQAGRLFGDAGSDTLYGSTGDDLLFGGAGDDTLYGDHGEDILDGGAGTDRLVGGYSNDVFVFAKGSGHDTVDAYEGSYSKQDRIRLAGLSPEAVIFETVTRVEGNYTYFDLRIRIKETDETLTVLSGAGNDSRRQIQSVEFGDGTVWSWAEVKQYGLNAVQGSSGDDLLQCGQAGALLGNEGNDSLIGGMGSDRLFGGAGNDTLSGGAGNDILNGGTDNDTFVFDTVLHATENVASIVDFASGEDRIQLEQSIFSALMTEMREGQESMTLPDDCFAANSDGTALTDRDFILYNTTSGALLYDADGNGQGVAVQFATLTNKPELNAKDFVIAA